MTASHLFHQGHDEQVLVVGRLASPCSGASSNWLGATSLCLVFREYHTYKPQIPNLSYRHHSRGDSPKIMVLQLLILADSCPIKVLPVNAKSGRVAYKPSSTKNTLVPNLNRRLLVTLGSKYLQTAVAASLIACNAFNKEELSYPKDSPVYRNKYGNE